MFDIDEVFVVMQPLDDPDVLRVHAWGVVGNLCQCDPKAPADYLDCGRIDPACQALPPCNAAGFASN